MRIALMERAFGKKLCVLLAGGTTEERAEMQTNLLKSSRLYEFSECSSSEETLTFLYQAAIRRALPDCLIIDMAIPTTGGIELLHHMNRAWGHVQLPIILLSSAEQSSELDYASQALALGAQDYLSKQALHDGVLSRSIFNAIERFKLISENKKILSDLNDREEQYRLATEAAHVGPWIYIDKGGFKCMGSCRELHGLRADTEFFSQDEFFKFVHSEDRKMLVAKLRQMMDGDEESDFKVEYRIHKSDGLYRWVLAKGRVYRVDGEPPRLIGIMQDITTQKEASEVRKNIERNLVETLQFAEEARDRAEEANLAKSELLANVSHEIRTPMNAVIGLAQILATSHPLTNKQQECIRTLHMSADTLLTLINDLLDLTKLETQAVELESIPFDLSQIAQEVIDILSVRACEKSLRLTLDNACHGTTAYLGDPARLKQILMNICSNAVKFTDQGSVEIRIKAERTKNGPDQVMISCIDTGIGISPEKTDAIFQKFVQADASINRQYGGSGLGLTITQALVEMMGGKISVSSKPGQGSIFTVTLPLRRADARPDEENLPAIERITADKPVAGHRILLVEDYPANVLVATMFLEQFGYSFDVASNGIEAVEKVQNGTDYAAILMDVQMQDMDGLEATRNIRLFEKSKSRHRMPIIGMTAHAFTGDRERCLNVGMDDYISKPFNPSELCEKLRIYSHR